MEGCGGANLLAPPVKEEVSDGEEKAEEDAVGEVKRHQWQILRIRRRFVVVVVVMGKFLWWFEVFAGRGRWKSGGGKRSPANVHLACV